MKKHTGFTLIEVLVVVIIIAVLAAVAVPQYQKAVLKSKFSSLLPTTKAVRDGNEAYYLAHGRYATATNQLDVTATNNEDMTLELSRDPDYSYVLATHPDLSEKNNLIMYQKQSAQFPGEIHCEAKAEDTQAQWLCERGMHATRSLGEVITEGYNTYVLEGTGNGLTPAQMAAAQNVPTCDTAYTAGATSCHITEATGNTPKTKQVCYSIKGDDDYCVTTEFNEDGKKTRRLSCTSSKCYESRYDADGHETGSGSCNISQMSTDKRYCETYTDIQEYTYENGKLVWKGNCTGGSGGGLSSDKKSCSSYSWIYEYEYGDNVIIERSCMSYNNGINGRGCRGGYYIVSETEYDDNGRISQYKMCWEPHGDNCSTYNNIAKYEYEDGNKVVTYCNRINGNVCEEYRDYVSLYTVDEDGNNTSYKDCRWNADHTECLQTGSFNYEYH